MLSGGGMSPGLPNAQKGSTRFSETIFGRNALRTSLRLSRIGMTTFYLRTSAAFISTPFPSRQAPRLIAPSPRPPTGCPIAPSASPHRGLRAPAPLPLPGERSRAHCARASRAIPPRATRERIHSPEKKGTYIDDSLWTSLPDLSRKAPPLSLAHLRGLALGLRAIRENLVGDQVEESFRHVFLASNGHPHETHSPCGW